MAKVEGPQEIPAELLDGYRAAMGEITPIDGVRKRYPYRVPPMQTLVGHPSTKQKGQRDRFNLVTEKFNALTTAERQRWYAAMPEWGSLLWYYNFFMLSGIMDVLGADGRGAQVIKSIQNIKDTIPIGGKTVAIPVNIVIAKTVIMLWGSTYNYIAFEADGGQWAAPAWPVYPAWDNLTVNSIDISWSVAAKIAADVSIQVIEYI